MSVWHFVHPVLYELICLLLSPCTSSIIIFCIFYLFFTSLTFPLTFPSSLLVWATLFLTQVAVMCQIKVGLWSQLLTFHLIDLPFRLAQAQSNFKYAQSFFFRAVHNASLRATVSFGLPAEYQLSSQWATHYAQLLPLIGNIRFLVMKIKQQSLQTLNGLPVPHRANKWDTMYAHPTGSILKWLVKLTHMFWDHGGRPEYLERTQTYAGCTCKPLTGRPQLRFKLGICANHCAAPPYHTMENHFNAYDTHIGMS